MCSIPENVPRFQKNVFHIPEERHLGLASLLILWNIIIGIYMYLMFYRLPIPRPGEVLGLVGTNGIGKSTALKILAGKQKPNLGRYSVSPRLKEIINY